MFNDGNWNFEYPATQTGGDVLKREGVNGVFGEDWEGDVVAVRTNGASGAVHMAGVFLKRHYSPWKGKDDGEKKVWISNETWSTPPPPSFCIRNTN